MKQQSWRIVVYMISIAVLFNVFYSYMLRESGPTAEISYSRFRAELAANNLK